MASFPNRTRRRGFYSKLSETETPVPQPVVENNETHFPVLCTAAPKNPAWSGRKTFSQLASEWKTQDEEKKRIEEIEKATGIDTDAPFVLPTFNNIHRYVEPEEEPPVEEPPKTLSPEDQEEIGWTIVQNRKPRIKKEREFKEDDCDQSSQSSRDETVWNSREEHETCWDDRRNY